jgi:HK97 family phage major capsid protein
VKALELIRGERAQLEGQREAVIEALESVATTAIAEERSLSTDDDAAVSARQAEIADIDEKLTAIDEREAELVAIDERSKVIASRPSLQFTPKPDAVDVLADRGASPQELADTLTRSLENKVDDPEHMDDVRKLVLRHRKDTEWARGLVIRSTEVYEEAFSKAITGRMWDLTPEERTALSTLTDANGNFLVPTHLDPTVILTNSGTSNAIRGMSRVVTLTSPGDTSWQGITSAGVTSVWEAQLSEVNDISPTFAQPTISVHKAQGLVQASLEAIDDIPGLAGEILMMFADARDRLEGAAHATGSGTNEPFGIFTALDANTNVEIISTTANVLGKVDLDSVYRQVPVRWRNRATWLMNPLWLLEIQNLGTALGASYSTNLTQGLTDLLYGRPVVQSDDAPSTETTTVNDNTIVLGDFSNYVIVDKPGSFAVEFVPHLFNTSNNLPDGRRAWYCHWRTGGDSVNDVAFRLLQEKTSA